MCNYSEFLKQEAKEEARKEKNLEVLEQLELLHFSNKKIMMILQVNMEQLKSLREMLREKRAAIMGEDGTWKLNRHPVIESISEKQQEDSCLLFQRHGQQAIDAFQIADFN